MHTGQTERTGKGGSLSEAGNNAGQAGVVASQRDIADWLCTKTPSEVDAAAVSRASQRGVRLTAAYEWRPKYDEDGAFLGASTPMSGFAVYGSAADAEALLPDIRKLLTPASRASIEAWLAELSVIAPKRASDEFEEILRLEAYTSRLARYPADVVRYALLDRPWRFWPSWAELHTVCEEVTAKRIAMIAAIEDRISRGDGPAVPFCKPPRRARVSPEKASAIIAEIYGDRMDGGST